MLVLMLALSTSACAQTPRVAATSAPGGEPLVLYAGMIQSTSYTVGSRLMESGLVRYEGDSTWTHIGWNTPRISAVAVDPTDPATIYLASGNGVLRTYDAGENWRITTDWRVTEVLDVALDPAQPSHVYLASGYGIWRSENQGDEWTRSTQGIPVGKTYTEALRVDQTTSGRLLAGTTDGVYLSTDGARTWIRATGLPADTEVIDLKQSQTQPARWLAATFRRGVYQSDDGGRTWRAGPRALSAKTIHAVAISPHDADRMIAAGWDTGVYLSTNGGRSWKKRGDRLPTERFYEATFDANVPGRIWAATLEKGLYHSDDDGRTWTSAGLFGTMIFDLTFAPAP